MDKVIRSENSPRPDTTAASNRRGARPNRRKLANQLVGLICELRLTAGSHLREQHLGDLLGVSRTPIRAALQVLAERGIVETRKNQGYFLVKAHHQLGKVEIAVPAMPDQLLYERLVKERIAKRLPDSFTQAEIATLYGADRITMHRTLALMAEDGLIARNKGHGWHFLPTLDGHVALQSSYEYRMAVEPALFLFSTFRADREILEKARERHLELLEHPNITSLQAQKIFSIDASFHEMMAEFSGNIFTLQAVQQQNRLRRLLEYNSYEDRKRVKAWCLEHITIIDATLENDLMKASRAMHDHLSSGYRVTPPIQPKTR
ncbi:MAG: GntR family transcriptional regulator [Rhizobium sp.]